MTREMMLKVERWSAKMTALFPLASKGLVKHLIREQDVDSARRD